MAVNWTVIRGAAPVSLAIPVPSLHRDITLAWGIPLTGATSVLSVNQTVIRGAAPENLAIPVPLLLWQLLLVPHLFPCSSINMTTVFCIAPAPAPADTFPAVIQSVSSRQNLYSWDPPPTNFVPQKWQKQSKSTQNPLSHYFVESSGGKARI